MKQAAPPNQGATVGREGPAAISAFKGTVPVFVARRWDFPLPDPEAKREMSKFLVNFIAFALSLAAAVLVAFRLSCWLGVLVLVACLFLAEKARLLR